jgi:dihydrofolate reductase
MDKPPPPAKAAPPISLVVVAAVARNGALGRNNALPWRAPSDLRRFRHITWGRPLIMGRKTFQSIGGPLPGRETIVLTRDPKSLAGPRPKHVHVAENFDAGLTLADDLARAMGATEAILAGGAEIFRLGLPRARILRLTLVDCAPEADVFFPAIEWREWRETRRERPPRGAKDEFALEFVDYQRI